jgi:hypothetical protein
MALAAVYRSNVLSPTSANLSVLGRPKERDGVDAIGLDKHLHRDTANCALANISYQNGSALVITPCIIQELLSSSLI